MVKEPSAGGTGGAGPAKPSAADARKKRLAEALRRNLAKRKDKKETNPGSNQAD